jgi:hypothetical protein
MEIYSVAPILVLHLKRFSTKINSLGKTNFLALHNQKLTNFINFPLRNFNIAPFLGNNLNNRDKKS